MKKIDDEYLNILEQRLLWCEDAYGGRHKRAAVKSIIWSVGYLLFGKDLREKHRADYEDSNYECSTDENCCVCSEIKRKESNDTCHIAMISSGGMGDHILFANYVYMFWQKYSKKCKIIIDVVFKDKYNLATYIFKEGDFVRQTLDYATYEMISDIYDLAIDMAGFPKIESIKRDRISICFKELGKYVEKCEQYKGYCRSAFRGNAYGMAKICEIEGRKLIQRGDIYGLLGINEEYKYPLFIDVDEDTYLKEIGLTSKEFITIQTGIDVIYDSHVKQWPVEYYKELEKLIHAQYPDLLIVQVGNSGEECFQNSEYFMSLVNRTTIDQAKILMKHSLIHIDIEGGMVHLRHALKGGVSIVLFGPTSIEFFGYSENCNLRSSVCNETCYQLTDKWPTECPKYGKAKCMQELLPTYVFEKFKEVYAEVQK